MFVQSALHEVSDLCTREGISIDPSKAVVVPITTRRKLNLGPIALTGTTMGFSDEV